MREDQSAVPRGTGAPRESKPPSAATRPAPRIVTDFDYEGYQWLVLDWPASDDDPTSDRFEVYRADLPWNWRNSPYEDVRYARSSRTSTRHMKAKP